MTANSAAYGTISPRTHPGVVGLSVGDLARSLDFYTGALGLDVMEHHDDKNAGQVRLGSHGQTLLHLVEETGASPWPGRGYVGLYHFAILYPTRLGLAQALNRLVEGSVPLEGASDHGVSEAIYLRDPDGHGIELYRDRPRDQWPFQNGALQMVSDPLDLRGILGELQRQTPDWEGTEPGTRMGHVHLHTNDLGAAQEFYGTVMGLELMQNYGGSAIFMSAGGYHHHLGLNLWAGRDVPPFAQGARLLWYEWVVPDGLDAVVARIEAAGYTVREASEDVWEFQDHAGLAVRLRAAPEN